MRHLAGCDGIQREGRFPMSGLIVFPAMAYDRHIFQDIDTRSYVYIFYVCLLEGWTSQAGDIFFVDDGAQLSGCKFLTFDCDSIVH